MFDVKHVAVITVFGAIFAAGEAHAQAEPPPLWTCEAAYFDDGSGCDCGCGAADPDCFNGGLETCDFNGCPNGDVPNALDPALCAVPVCGDGWKSGNERCDDGDAADGNGCSADCREVEPNFQCGDDGQGCVSICGNGLWDYFTETCDDGNNNDGDGCDAACHVEDGYVCNGGSCYVPFCGDGFAEFDYYARTGEDCDDGNNEAGDGCDRCNTEPGFVCDSVFGDGCRRVECGDGFWEFDFNTYSGEGCDDGNVTGGDGCSNICEVEDGFLCPEMGFPCVRLVCGDGVVAFNYYDYTGELCDDGNLVNNDGCSELCVPEPGFACSAPGEDCHRIECGDGFQDFDQLTGFYESCDDGNAESGDGCSSSCNNEPGFSCAFPGEPCVEVVCGDGVISFDTFNFIQEACDDGNTEAGDGCSANCDFVEPGFVCPFEGGPCRAPICGDGNIEGNESCEDGNDADGDGCSECNTEPGFFCPVPNEPCNQLPDGWVCAGAFYNADDGCDCGCGAFDEDCPDNDVDSCDFDQCFLQGELVNPDDPRFCGGDTGEGEGEGEGEGGDGGGDGGDDDTDGFADPEIIPDTGCSAHVSSSRSTPTPTLALTAVALGLVALLRPRRGRR